MSKTNDVRSLNVRKYQGGDQRFLSACAKANTPPTNRQYRKWQDGRGIAWKNR